MQAVPEVSVIMPCYNAEKYLEQALASLMEYNEIETEVIVVDDGSTDRSRDIAKGFPFVRLITQANLGACKARNVGLANANGQYVKFLDADDLIEIHSLALQVKFMRTTDEKNIVYSDVIYFDDISFSEISRTNALEPHFDQVKQLLKENMQTSRPLHRKSNLLKIGGFDERFLRAQEYNLHLRLAMAGYKFTYLPCVIARIREHDLPSRITNMAQSDGFVENGELRSRVYFDLIHKYYNGEVPVHIRRHFTENASFSALLYMSKGDISQAKRAVLYAMKFQPSWIDWFLSFSITLRKIFYLKSKSLIGHIFANKN